MGRSSRRKSKPIEGWKRAGGKMIHEKWASINKDLRRQAGQQRESKLIAQPAHWTWTADFMLREGQSRLELGKWL